MKNIPRLLGFLALSAWATMGATAAQFPVSLDQSSLTSTGNVSVSGSPGSGQTFRVAITGRLEGIELAPLLGSSISGDMIHIKVFVNNWMGQLLGMTSRSVAGFPPGAGVVPGPLSSSSIGPGYFDFSREGIHVSAGQTIYIEIKHSSFARDIRLGSDDDVYSGGTRYGGGVPHATKDLAFKTFVAPCAACGCVSSAFRNGGTNSSSYTANLPVLGGTYQAKVSPWMTGHGAAILFGYDTATNFPLSGGQTLLAIGTFELLGTPALVGSVVNFALPIPNDPGLCGLTFSTQAIHIGGAPDFALSNALDLRLGL